MPFYLSTAFVNPYVINNYKGFLIMLAFPKNPEYPAYAWDQLIKALAQDPDSIDADTYIVPRNNACCISVKQVIFEYDGNGPIPVTTKRQVPLKLSIREFLCYLFGYNTLEQFHSMGVHTWDKDATQNQSWLNSKHRKGPGDLGNIYGHYARNRVAPDGEVMDTFAQLIDKLRAGIYDRRLIFNMYDPFVQGALPACMYEHVFTVHKGKLNLTSSQRSCDSSLGGAFNSPQTHFFLNFVAALTGYKVGNILHNVHDLHIYDNQIDAINEFIDNERYPDTAVLELGPLINTTLSLEDLEKLPVAEIFNVSGYKSHGKYEIPLTV